MLYPISVPKPDSADDLVGYIDCFGRSVVTPRFGAGSCFSEGLASVCLDDATSGFIDANGFERTPFQYRGLGLFQEGLCSIGYGFKVGYIDRGGRWQIEPVFAVAGRFSEGLAIVSLDGSAFGVIDRAGAFLVKPLYEGLGVFGEGLCAARLRQQWGYIDRSGTVVIPFQFEGPRAQAFSNGLAGVSVGNRWGFINRSGDWVVMPRYEDVGRFYEGSAPVKCDGKWGAIDTCGQWRFLPKLDDLGEFEGGLATACLDGRAGYVSPDGQWVIEPCFDQSFRFRGDLAIVRAGDKYSYVSRGGSVIWTSEPYAIAQVPPYRE